MAAALAMGAAACSGDSGASDGSSTTRTDGTSITESSDAGAATSTSTGSGGEVAGSSTTVLGEAGTATTSASATTAGGAGDAPDDTDPFATTPEPDPEEPDDMPGPPAEDCVDAPVGPATVELAFDDDQVLYEGAQAPSCVRVHAGQQLVLRNAGSVTASVVIGLDSFEVAVGASVAAGVLAATYEVGDVFDVYVATIDTNVVVQVLP